MSREGGLEELVRNGLAFVITRTNSVIYRRPEFNQEIRLTTWHRSSKGVQFFRCYQFTVKRQPLIESVSAFVLVDPDTHKILRPRFSSFAVTEQPDRLNGCPDPENAAYRMACSPPDSGCALVRYRL